MIFPGKSLVWWGKDGYWRIRDPNGSIVRCRNVRIDGEAHTANKDDAWLELDGGPRGILVVWGKAEESGTEPG